MKFIKWKKALTLMELVISITISSMVLMIVMTFIADSVETVVWSNKKTEVFDNVFSFKDHFWRFSRWGYLNNTLLIDNESWTWNDIILLKNIDNTEWVIFGVVDSETLQLETNADYKIYKNKVLWYRKLSASEIISLEAVPISVYNMKFFHDKLFQWTKIKDFQIDFYNSNTILDINMEILIYYNATHNGILLESVNSSDLININLNF